MRGQVIGVLITALGAVVALCAWLFPVHPFITSPFAPKAEPSNLERPAKAELPDGGSRETQPDAKPVNLGRRLLNKGAVEGGDWVVVLCGNQEIQNARAFASQYAAYRPTIYLRGTFKTTVGPYDSERSARLALKKFRSEIASDAYIQNLDLWCNNPVPSGEDYFICQ